MYRAAEESVTVNPSATVQIRVSAMRFYGENDVASALGSIFFQRVPTGASDPNPEKSNTRSATASSLYRYNFGFGSTFATIIASRPNSCSHQSHVWNPRYPFIAEGSADCWGSGHKAGVAIQNWSLCWREGDLTPARNLSRRTTKPGYWPMFGNNIGHHSKTGGGAFTMKMPHFDNDITWQDSSVWRLGTGIAAANLNLFAPLAAQKIYQRTLTGVGL